MSMSQEDIEALMNGLDIPEETIPETTNKDEIENKDSEKVNTKEIEELLSQSEDKNESASQTNSSEKKINEIETLLNDIEDKTLEKELEEISEVKKEEQKKEDKSQDDIVKEWSSSKINEGIFPFPAEDDTKVVTQLSQVANDSEEKVSQIFDVLSLALDNNGESRKKIKEYEEFLNSQKKLLNSLSSKFPNIKLFDSQLEKVKNFEDSLNNFKTVLDDEDMHIFQGMELMQFNDINRQKIERVMSVIRKLSIYLNNLFEEDSPKDIPMARHIHGDSGTNDLVGDDLDKLIAEFNN